METREQKLQAELKEANDELKQARLFFADAKKKLIEAESGIIDAKLKVEKLSEELRKIGIQKVIPGQHYSLFDDDDGG